MTLRKIRVRSEGVACLIAIAALLAGCGGSSNPVTAPSGSGGPTGGTSTGTGTGTNSGTGTHTAIQGVATPSSVSVVTAN